MNDQPSTIDNLVSLVKEVRQVQMKYFALASGAIVGATEREKLQTLKLCKKLEADLDEWLALYDAEAARWRRFVGARECNEDKVLEEGEGDIVAGTQPNIGAWL